MKVRKPHLAVSVVGLFALGLSVTFHSTTQREPEVRVAATNALEVIVTDTAPNVKIDGTQIYDYESGASDELLIVKAVYRCG